MNEKDSQDLLEAARVLDSMGVGDFVYQIRERCLNDVPDGVSTWEAPRVKRWAAACTKIAEIVKKYRADPEL